MLVEIPPKYSVSSVVGYLKGATARLMRLHFKYLARPKSMWAPGFFVSTVGIDSKAIKLYIRHQRKQERGQVKLV